MNKVDKETLYELYVIRGKPMQEVAYEMGIAVGTVFNYLHKYGIDTREAHKGFKGKVHSNITKKKIGKAHKGKIVSEATRKRMSESAKEGGIGHKKKEPMGIFAFTFQTILKATKTDILWNMIWLWNAL